MKFYFNTKNIDFEKEMINYLFREIFVKYNFPKFELNIYDHFYLQLYVRTYDKSSFIEEATNDLHKFFTENPLRDKAVYISVKPYIVPDGKWEIKFDKVEL